MTPLDYFRLFWTEELSDLIADNTNLYSTQKSGISVNTNRKEIEQFIGMHMKMGIVTLPSYALYWSNKLRYPPIADSMPLKSFEKLRRFLHVVDNNTYDAASNDKLFKVRPVLERVRERCLIIEPEENHSVDEQIIPSKTKYSKVRQYNPKKPVKWGFKNLVRAGSSGFMYDFYVYAGKDGAHQQRGNDYNHFQKSAQVVPKLCEHLPVNNNHKLYFDNWFTTLDLLIYLKRKGILACGTIRADKLQGCPLQSTKDLAKLGRGSIDFKSDMNSGILIVKWYDNNAVHMASNYVGIEPMAEAERWCPNAKACINVGCPQVIKAYNGGMGGIDLADMLIALYRIMIKTKRWYLKIFWHCVDIAEVNAWILCRRDCRERQIPQRKQLALLNFSLEVAEGLMVQNKVVTSTPRTGKAGRPTKRKAAECNETPLKGQKAFKPLPSNALRYDQKGHWPEIRSDEKGRCHQCQTGFPRVYCLKCDMCLCLTGEKNCFVEFHTI